MANDQANQPTTTKAAYDAQVEAWDLLDDLMAGTPRLREAADVYLPKFPLETDDLWRQRVGRTELYNGLSATVGGLTGLALRKPPQLGEDAPPLLLEHIEDIDLQGTHLAVFARELFEDGMLHGHGGVLVDYPAVDPSAVTLAAERAGGIRPYWVRLEARQIVNWRTAREGGKLVFTLLVIAETVAEPDGLFGETAEARYRVFRREGGKVTWEVWTPRSGTDANPVYDKTAEGVVMGAGRKPLTRIPFAPNYAGRRLDVLTTQPPLLDLAYTNLAHFQVTADHRTSAHYASVPVLVRVGADPNEKEVAVGGPVGIDVPVGGNAFYVQGAGESLDQTRLDQKELEARMASQGMALLARETRAAETAEAKRIDQAEQHSRLAVAVRGLQDCLEQAFTFHAEYLGLDAPSIDVNLDFAGLAMDPAMITAYLQMRQQRDLSQETLWTVLKAGRSLPDDFDPEMERQRLADELAGELPPLDQAA